MKRFTLRDPNLTHQVIFAYSHNVGIQISCNCVNGSIMGFGPTLAEARVVYNDPTNHIKPFTDEDKAKW